MQIVKLNIKIISGIPGYFNANLWFTNFLAAIWLCRFCQRGLLRLIAAKHMISNEGRMTSSIKISISLRFAKDILAVNFYTNLWPSFILFLFISFAFLIRLFLSKKFCKLSFGIRLVFLSFWSLTFLVKLVIVC